MATVIFSDRATSNTAIRQQNIATLNAAGFVAGGLQCRSGELSMVEKTTKTQLVFGTRANIGGRRNKYFSMSKDFASKQEAEAFAKNLTLQAK